MTLSNRVKYEILDILGRIIAALPPFITTLHFFPMWIDESPGATVSGIAVIAFIVCMIPMWKKIASLKSFIFSASMPVFWIILFAVFYFLQYIASSIVFISLAGLAGSFLCIPVTLWRNKYRCPISGNTKIIE